MAGNHLLKILAASRPLVAAALLSAPLLSAALDHALANTRKREEPKPAPTVSDVLQGPARLAVVSLARQHVTFYDAGGRSVRAPISSGQSGMDTPVGVYSILQKKVDHTSNIYDDAKMPFMQRITWSGVALHAGALPGYPASHGCVRLPIGFAEQIFDKTNLGLRVVISRDDVTPVAIEHDALFQPRPLDEAALANIEPAAFADEAPPLMPDVAAWPMRYREQVRLRAVVAEKVEALKAAAEAVEPLKTVFDEKSAQQKKFLRSIKSAEAEKVAATKRLARAEKSLAAAKKPKAIERAEAELANAKTAMAAAEAKLQPSAAERERIEGELSAAKSAFDAAESKRAAAAQEHAEARRKILPVSVFISRETQRLYLRQGHAPVTEIPVEIKDPDTPIGTHVFTALDYTPDGNAARWNVVSIARHEDSYGGYDEFDDFNRRRKKDTRPAAATNAEAAAAALERITLPADLKEALSEYVWPGSSIIVSDEPMHKKETNDHTDFVVLLSGYPQGGIKKRPPPPVYDYDYGLFSYYGNSPYAPRYGSRNYYRDYYRDPYVSRGYGTRPRYKKKPSLFSWW
jgi:lipoprotein-anchoring transpeptidase ErfK/SrfK